MPETQPTTIDPDRIAIAEEAERILTQLYGPAGDDDPDPDEE